jgi:RND superfamily putative drug exporter
LVALVFVPVAALIGGGVRDRLSVGGFTDPGAEASRTEHAIEDVFDAGPQNHVFILQMREGRVDDPENEAAGRALTAQVAAEPGVADVVSYWTLDLVPPPRILRGSDAQAMLGMRLVGDEDEQRDTARRLQEYVGETGRFVIGATGVVEISREAAEIAEEDLTRAELLAAPLTFLALVIVFRGLRAGLLPLAIAVVAVLGTFAVLTLLALVTDVSVFAVNLTTALGLGLAIDYSLLLVARYREEVGAGRTHERALRRSMQTAGRTVAFSAGTVAASLIALLVFPIVYLRSFAYAGVTVVIVAAIAALVVLPALLAWLGPRIGGQTRATAREPFWGRQARRVLRRPALWAVGSTVVLVALAIPFLSLRPGRIDERVLPEHADARRTMQAVRDDFFGITQANPIAVFVPGADPTDEDAILEYESAVLALPGVSRVDSPLGFRQLVGRVGPVDYNQRFADEEGVWFNIVSFYEPEDERIEGLVEAVRATPGPYEEVFVGGPLASTVDTVDAVVARVPLALVIIAVVTVVLLFMLTGSVVIPVKAVILNLLSLTATFGALVWIFQEGHLADWLDFTPTERLDIFTPILMFCIAFGLSMDYEVFVLARMKEEYDLTGSNREAIIGGLARTGGLVTAAAVILTIVFVSISTSGVTIVKMFGVGLGLAVLIDAFVVRATLIPALMALAGRFNWWAPGPLRRFHLRWGIWEADPVELPSAMERPSAAEVPT